MPCPDRLSQWSQQVSTAFGHLSKPQVWGLVLWSAGIALTGTAGITQISALLALVLGQQEQAVFQRLREWYLDAKHKSGKKRRELDVTTCFAPLLQWIVRLWGNGNQQMVLVLDATSLGERWTILSISVVARSCAIPVAWKVLGGHEKGSWQPHWKGLLKHLDGSIPADWQVLVMADRGLYAHWLFQAILDCGWHPFLRINLGVKARAVGEEAFDWIGRWALEPGTHWKGKVECFVGKASRLTCTLLMHWEAGYEHPWAILTDLCPEQAEVSWYGMRTWIESGFKDFKRGLWGWHHSKMQEASRVERLWLAMAVAQVWTLSVGCQAEEQERQKPHGEALPAQHIACRRRKRAAGQPPERRLSCVVRGRLGLVAALFKAEVLPCGRLIAEAWSQSITAPRKLPKPSQLRQRERKRAQKRRARARARTAA
ncbi:MAG: hypothetical protein J2P36_09835 [Ktedonobacteraceae bacterium]|nr:hypothetical protein [Ktedonobacteraceae bacterium]